MIRLAAPMPLVLCKDGRTVSQPANLRAGQYLITAMRPRAGCQVSLRRSCPKVVSGSHSFSRQCDDPRRVDGLPCARTGSALR